MCPVVSGTKKSADPRVLSSMDQTCSSLTLGLRSREFGHQVNMLSTPDHLLLPLLLLSMVDRGQHGHFQHNTSTVGSDNSAKPLVPMTLLPVHRLSCLDHFLRAPNYCTPEHPTRPFVLEML